MSDIYLNFIHQTPS